MLFAILLAAIARFGVNFPVWDQWDTPGLMFVRAYQGKFDWLAGQFDWPFLIAQHNESRKLFPRLILVSLAAVTDWNVKVEMFLIAGLMGLIAVELYLLSRLTLVGISQRWQGGLAVVANLLVFSLIQYDNFLLGLQVCVLLSLWAIVTGLLIAQTRWQLGWKTLLGVVLCTVSTYSFSNGLLSWIVIFPALFWARRWTKDALRSRLPWMGVWGLGMAVNLGAYFRDYIKPPEHPDVSSASVWEIGHYVLVFLGSPLASRDLSIATWVGLAILVSWLGCVVGLLWPSPQMSDRLFRAKSWIMLGSYAFISGSFAAIGRAGFGVEQALSPRYTTFSLYAIVSIIYLSALVLERDLTAFPNLDRRPYLWGIFGFGLALHLQTSMVAIAGMQERQTDTYHAQACTLLMPVVRDEACLREYVYPKLDRLETHARAINALGYLNPPLIESEDLRQFSQPSTGRVVGNFDALSAVDGDRYSVAGWAVLTQRRRPADVVVLSYRTPQGAEKPFAIADHFQGRSDLPQFPGASSFNLGWTDEFSSTALPSGRQTIRAWAFDATTAQAYPLPGQFDLVVP